MAVVQGMDYDTWRSLWQKGDRTHCFCADGNDDAGTNELPLSERLLFTQSNARVLLGQTAQGHLSFVCAPHGNDYPIPTGVTEKGFPITACPGMYDQVDVAMWFGDARYEVELNGDDAPIANSEPDQTWYMNHYLPMTRQIKRGLETHILSIAPVLEPDTRSVGIPGTPLPGPSGAIYTMVLQNQSDKAISGKCRLKFERRFVIRSEYNGFDPFEKDCLEPYHCEWEGNVYVMWRPDACAAIYLQDGIRGNTELDWFVPFSLSPGEEKTIVCRIAVSPEKQGLSEAMAALLRHDPLEWINITTNFWKSRLGYLDLRLDAPEEMTEAYAGFQIRNFFDNFNCLQTDANGRLLVHWQGAPSHNIGRFWGIDIEPTVNSLLYALPELGPVALRYIADHNEPEFSMYSDHSIPIRAALLIIAGKYLELTGDVQFFRNETHVMNAIHKTFERILAAKHDRLDLFSSRYSSDGIVFHRYDVGTNVKVWLALGGYQRILNALGEPCRVDLNELREHLRRDLFRELVEEGPFGPQFIGGKTFDEDRSFYFRDDLFYYDGEDSTSCMMPIYGFCSFDDPAWQNYHRFARSLFCSNYDPEMHALRWFFYGGAVDGTAYVSALGGSVTREEMRTALKHLIQCDLDVTGSLFWWPKGINRRRCIARCSQGQGSWMIQGIEQWLGLHYDALDRMLTVCPRGLATACHWSGMHIGKGWFDIDWSETNDVFRLAVRNRCKDMIHLRVGIRESGCGCNGPVSWHTLDIMPGELVEHRWAMASAAPLPEIDIVSEELRQLSAEEELFAFPGLQFPSAEQETNAFLLRCVWVPHVDCTMACIRIEAPDGWGVEAKLLCHWPNLDKMQTACASLEWSQISAGERIVAPFFIRMPEYADASNVWQAIHPFAYPPMQGEPGAFAASKVQERAELTATLLYNDHEGTHEFHRKLPIHMITPEEHADITHKIAYGKF